MLYTYFDPMMYNIVIEILSRRKNVKTKAIIAIIMLIRINIGNNIIMSTRLTEKSYKRFKFTPLSGVHQAFLPDQKI